MFGFFYEFGNTDTIPTVNQAVLLPVFLVSLVVVLTVLVRLPSVTSAALVACSLLPRSGESGTARSILARSRSFSVS